MMKGILRYFLLSLLIIYYVSSSSIYTSAQLLPTEELSSAIWIIEQYKLDVPMNVSLCNSTNVFTCIEKSGFLHIQNISITSDVISHNLPDPNISFYFPELATIYISTSTITDLSQNILTHLTGLPLLFSISLDDPSVTYIPTVFPSGLPNLIKFETGNSCTFTTLPTTFFINSATLLQLFLKTISLASLDINASIHAKSLAEIEVDFNASTTQDYTFTQSSFPYLASITIRSGSDAKIIIRHQSPIIKKILLDTHPANTTTVPYELYSLYPTSITFLGLTQSPIVSPSLDEFTGLTTLLYTNSPIISYPFNQFPPKLKVLHLPSSGLMRIPNVTLPSSMSLIDFQSSNLQGTVPIPWNVFDNTVNLTLILSNNPNFIAQVPDSLCSVSMLLATNTSITQIPDCFWCYPGHVITNLNEPISLQCNTIVSLPTNRVITSKGSAILEGNNLGWGTTSNTTYYMTPLIPNKRMKFVIRSGYYTNYYIESPLRVSFDSTYNETKSTELSILEAGIDINNITYNQQPNGVSFNISFNSINQYLNHSITLLPSSSSSSSIPCLSSSNSTTSTLISCIVDVQSLGPGGYYNLTVTNDYFNSTYNLYYIQKYPKVSSAVHSTITTTTTISLAGYFGESPDTGYASVMINNTIPCLIQFATPNMINCTIESSNIKLGGVASLLVTIDNATFTHPSLLYFPINNNNNGSTTGGSGPTPKEQCDTNTHNCYGNGECQDNGECKCNPGYSQLDNCLTKHFNGSIPIEANQTSPVTKFNIDGVDFMFEMYSIQELSLDSISREIPTVSWISNITKDGDLTTANYTLLSNETNANVTATIPFSSQSRQVSFGNKQINIDPNSIKVSVGIENWAFQSNIATLRVIFKTTINNEQLIGVGCDDQQTIDSFSYDSFGSTIQYLRVVKQGIQFTGRFLDYVVSDGRSTYSQTQLVSLNNTNDGNNNQSIAYIGINLPQCQHCLLDPDFTPLIIDNSNVDVGCQNNGDSKIWKIAVGVSVGGVAFIALVIGTIKYLKQTRLYKYKIKPIIMNKLK